MSHVRSRPLTMYLIVLEGSMGCVLGQHNETGRKEHAIYYLSKKFTDCCRNLGYEKLGIEPKNALTLKKGERKGKS